MFSFLVARLFLRSLVDTPSIVPAFLICFILAYSLSLLPVMCLLSTENHRVHVILANCSFSTREQ
jgi:hypothetical protein